MTVVSSLEKNVTKKLSVALAEGNFNDETTIKAKESSKTLPVKSGRVKVYDVSIENADKAKNKEVKLHLINENKDKVTAWTLKGGNWVKTKISSRGKYVILKTDSLSTAVCLKYSKNSHVVLKIALAVLVVATVAGAFAVKKRKYK